MKQPRVAEATISTKKILKRFRNQEKVLQVPFVFIVENTLLRALILDKR